MIITQACWLGVATQACWLGVATQACCGQAVHGFTITLCMLVKFRLVVSDLVGTRSGARLLAAFKLKP